MYIIGENIHIISEKVKVALKERDAKFFQDLAVKQVEAGAQVLDLNLGPRKKDWEEVFPWMVKTVEEVTDVPLCLDSPNPIAVSEALAISGAKAGPAPGRTWSGRALGASGGGPRAGPLPNADVAPW